MLLCECRDTKEPGSAETSYICSSLKDDANILTSIDGPNDNVLVMKPPLCFSIDDAETFLEALGKCCTMLDVEFYWCAAPPLSQLNLSSCVVAVVAMDSLSSIDLATISHTPT